MAEVLKRTIQQDGFLSSEIGECMKEHAQISGPWFNLAMDVNRIAHELHSVVMRPPEVEDRNIVIARLLYLRCHTSMQAAVNLTLQGFTTDARTLIRCAFESLFCLCAVKEGVDVVERLIEADIAHRKATGRELLKLPKELGFTEEISDRIKAFLEAHPEKPSKLDLFKFASDAKLGEVYTVYYRDLSNQAAHPTMTSLSRHLVMVGDDIESITYGPLAAKDVRHTMMMTTVVGFYLIQIASETFGASLYSQRIADLWPNFRDMLDMDYPDRAARA